MPENSQDSKFCPKCRKPKKQKDQGSVTRWIFQEFCVCDSQSDFGSNPEASTKADSTSAPRQTTSEIRPDGRRVCPNCKQPVQENQGSLTSWIFKENLCICARNNDSLFDFDNFKQFATIDAAGATTLDEVSRFDNVTEFATGGMGTVYKAVDKETKSTVAIKLLRQELAQHQSATARFQQEVRATSELTHPNLAGNHGLGFLEDGRPFLVMDFIEGESLHELLERRKQLPTEEALDIFLQLSHGLKYAHDKGIIHRDLKPGNIMITTDSTGATLVKLIDFGIAKIIESEEMQNLTRTGEIFGSPFYMSPEQSSAGKVDKRSDIYSFGCALFEALTGEPPFYADTAIGILLQHQHESPPTLNDAYPAGKFPAPLEQVMSKLLEKSPDKRYSDLFWLSQDLLWIKNGCNAKTRLQTDESAITQSQPQKPMRLVTVGVSALAIIVLTVSLAFRTFGGPKPVPVSSAGYSESSLANVGRSVNSLTALDKEYFAAETLEEARAHDKAWAFQFPERFSIGEIVTGFRSGKALTIRASGLIQLPHEPIRLRPSFEMVEQSKLFRKFRPNEVDILEFPASTSLSMSDETLFWISHLTGLKLLTIYGDISDKGLPQLNTLTQLRSLTLKGCAYSPDTLAKQPWFSRLEIFGGDNFTSASSLIDRVIASPRLTELSLGRAGVTDTDVIKLSECTRLRVLRLTNSPYGDVGAQELARLKNLRQLDVSGSNITDKVLPVLAKLPQLVTLNVTATKVTEKTVNLIHKQHPHLQLLSGAGDPGKDLDVIKQIGI